MQSDIFHFSETPKDKGKIELKLVQGKDAKGLRNRGINTFIDKTGESFRKKRLEIL